MACATDSERKINGLTFDKWLGRHKKKLPQGFADSQIAAVHWRSGHSLDFALYCFTLRKRLGTMPKEEE